MPNCVIYRRFSTDEQESGRGETLTRQLERCQAFAKSQGWQVIGAPLTDKGRSAFKGEHLAPDAALGGFIEAVRSGEIQPGTVLLAERLDRLSRRPVDETMAWIFGLTTAGIEIALADTGEVFRPGKMESFLGMAIRASLAHQESANKSDLGIRAKAKLWAKVENREPGWTNFAAKIPSWLSRNAECDGWIIDEARAAVVQSIYALAAEGLGSTAIAQRLNAVPVTPFANPTRYPGDKHAWGSSSVRQLLITPNVEGDWHGQSGPYAGRVIHGFYPRIVDADLVARARAEMALRKKVNGERSGSISSNLFAKITKCGSCGRKAFSYSTIKDGNAYAYVRCEAAGEGRCENTGGYAYRAFEKAALDLLLDYALDDRFFSATEDLRLARIRVAELEKDIGDRMKRRATLLERFSDDGDEQALSMIDKLKAEIDRLKAELNTAINQAAMASGKVSDVEHLRRVADVRDAAMSPDESIRLPARTKLRSAFASIVQQVDIERDDDGEKVFTVILLGGVMAVRIDTKGKLRKLISEALGRPLWTFLTTDQQASIAPLIQRIEKLAKS